jgi:uncharacterized membrane protein YedE/YeeE
VPKISGKYPPLIAAVAIAMMAGAYFVFLYATWMQYQKDRGIREARIDEILERLPVKKEVKPDGSDGGI